MFSLSGRLYRFDQVPSEFFELGIISGYRHPQSSFTECVRSLFSANNETMNFWTHFLAVWYFVWRLYGINQDIHFAADSYTWPLLAYIVISCLYPLASAMAHAFNTMSLRARHICFFFDYAALSLYSYGCAVIYKAYVWPTDLMGTAYSDYYLHGAFVNAVICTFLSGRTRFWKPGATNKIARLSAFALPYFYAIIPMVYRLVYCSLEGDCDSEAVHLHKRQFFFAFLTAFLYASHLPERIFPGSFDILGHSHQMFHVAAVFATRDVLNASISDLNMRRDLLLNTHAQSDYTWSLWLMLALVAINLLTIALHIRSLYKQAPEPINNNELKCHSQ